jgi:hypothetical protein
LGSNYLVLALGGFGLGLWDGIETWASARFSAPEELAVGFGIAVLQVWLYALMARYVVQALGGGPALKQRRWTAFPRLATGVALIWASMTSLPSTAALLFPNPAALFSSDAAGWALVPFQLALVVGLISVHWYLVTGLSMAVFLSADGNARALRAGFGMVRGLRTELWRILVIVSLSGAAIAIGLGLIATAVGYESEVILRASVSAVVTPFLVARWFEVYARRRPNVELVSRAPTAASV